LLLVAAHTASGGAAPTIFLSGFEAPTLATVQEIQLGIATGYVSLVDRVVTARSSDGKNLWIADSTTSAVYEGVFVFRGASAPVLPAEIAVGARVDVSGGVIEFDGSPPGVTLTEIVGPTVTFASAPQAAPSPFVFADVATLASLVDGEPMDGVLVTVSNVRVTALASGSRVTVIDNAGNSLVLDDDAGGYGFLPVVGTCYAVVIGVMYANTFDNERRLLPRGAADLTLGDGCN